MIYSDIRLLSIFDEIYKTRSVSGAADALSLGQPAVSVALGKLRQHFGEPLFVRTSAGMSPTPLAEELVRPVRTALEALDNVFGHRLTFDPQTSDRCFRICMSDITQVHVLPQIWPHISSTAPGIRIEIVPLVDVDAAAHLLEAGEVDLAVGFMPQLEAGFYQQLLFRHNYVVLVSSDHPRVRDTMTQQHLETEGHVAFATMGSGHQFIKQEFERHGVHRRIDLTIPNFLGAAFIVERTEMLMVIPRGVGELISSRGNFRIFPLPFPVPDFSVKQHWHERYHHDLGCRWLRTLISELVLPQIPDQSLKFRPVPPSIAPI